MAIADDFSIALNGDVRHVSGTTTYTVLELHRFLQDNADNASAATTNDLINITSDDPSSRATDQIVTLLGTYNIDDTAAQFIYGGSIRQGSGNTETLYSGLAVVGAVATSTQLQVVQDNALLTNYWGAATGTPPVSLNGAGNTLLRILVKSRDEGIDLDGKRVRVQSREFGDTYAEFGVTLGEGEATAAIFTGTDLNNDTAVGTVGAYDKHDNTEGYQGLDISGNGTNEFYYSQWEITGTGTLPATPTLKSLYEYTKHVGRRGTATTIHGINGELFRGVTHEIDHDATTGMVEDNTIVWGPNTVYTGTGGFTIGERIDFGTSGAVGIVLADDTTGNQIWYEIESGTPATTELITGFTSTATATTGGTLLEQSSTPGKGLLLALDDTGGMSWIQLTYGGAPDSGAVITDTANWNSGTTSAAAVQQTVSPEFIGTFTGSALIGAFGIGMKTTDASSADLFFPLDDNGDGSPITPPNNVQFDVNGLVIGDRVIVAADDGAGGLDFDQLSNNALLNGAAVGSVVVTEAIPADTPASGTIRVVNDEGRHIRLPYTSWATSTFTLTSTYDFSLTGDNDSVAATNDVYITYIDKDAGATTESFSTVYSSDRTLRARVRDGGGTPIKEATGTGTLGTNGGQININRISDE